jgi:phenylalanyl-tRNA synthetase alpha chain
MEQKYIKIDSPEEVEIAGRLNKRDDSEGLRLKRFLAMPDLSRTSGSPLAELAERIVALPRFANFEVLNVPEIVGYGLSFDLFNFPPDHPARSPSDTYFIDDNNILRTHTTVMWYYHLALPEVKSKIEKGKSVGALSHGKVYRKDEIDRNHMNVFHQMDGWYLCRKEEHVTIVQDLQDVLSEIARSVFGKNVEYRFNSDQFPYTDPSLEMEVRIGERWIEVLGAGVVRGSVLKNLGVDPDEYNGWAFGFGLERLAIISMDLPDIRLLWSQDERIKNQLKLGQKYKEVSKYPPITRDISFVVGKDFAPNNYFDLIRDLGGDLVEQVELIDKYEDSKKFGPDKISYTYRIVYRSMERTLKSGEVDEIQDEVYKQTAEQFNAELR